MTFAFLALATAALLCWLYFLWSRRRFYKVAWQLPGPLGLPFIGLGLNMMDPATFLQFMQRKSQQYTSPFISWMGTNCFLYANDPETVEAIFNSPHCTNKGDFYRFLSAAIGDGLFTSSSPRWNRHRRLINPAFSRQVIQNFLPIFNAEADALLHILTAGSETGAQLEIYELLKRSVLEMACQTTMGRKMNFQNDGSAAIFAAYNGITEVCVRRMLSPWLYAETLYRRSALYARQQRVVGVLYSFVESLLQRREHNTTHETVQSSAQCAAADDSDAAADVGIRRSKAIFVEQVRKYVEQGHFTWEDVRDEANVIIAATFETTSTALYLVCLCLAMHPECQDKLYHELVELFPDNVNANKLSTTNNNNKGEGESESDCHAMPQVTNEQLERMTYTELVINEAMRLFAPVPMVLRSASADFALTAGAAAGVVIPRGTQIGIDIYNMQRSELVWGAEARAFRPELHFGPEARPQRSAFAFVPFTKGLRMCIGYRYALMLMKVMLAKIFRNYRLHTTARLEELQVKGTISLKLHTYPLCELLPRER